MGSRTIKWSVRSIANRDKIAGYYKRELGQMAVEKWLRDLYITAHLVAQMPTAGRKDVRRSTKTHVYYSFLIHPKYRLVYRFTQRTLYIAGIASTQRMTKYI